MIYLVNKSAIHIESIVLAKNIETSYLDSLRTIKNK